MQRKRAAKNPIRGVAFFLEKNLENGSSLSKVPLFYVGHKQAHDGGLV